MERGTLIGGAVVVLLLGVFGGLFVSLNSGGGEDGDVDPVEVAVDADGTKVERYAPTGAQDPATAQADGAVGEPGPDGTVAEPAPVGLGADAWDAIRERKNAEMQTRAMDTLDTFLTPYSTADADIVRDAFEHMFATSTAIRADMKSGAIPLEKGRKEMAQLRQDTSRTITDALGPEALRKLRDDLRRADANVF